MVAKVAARFAFRERLSLNSDMVPQDFAMRATAPTLKSEPKLARIAASLRGTFGARLVSALLFGSRARGDHRPDSDYDIAVFLEGYDPATDRPVLDGVRRDLGEEVWTLQFWPMPPNGLAERTTLMFNIRNEGVPLPGLNWPPVVAPPIAPEDGPVKPETRSYLLQRTARSPPRKVCTPQALILPPPGKPITPFFTPPVH